MISDLESVIDDDSCVCAVNLGSHGSFARASIDLWDKTFKVDEISREVNYEHQWLSASTHKTLAIKNVLGNLRPEQTVLKHDHLNLDATDVSSLVGERYVSGFCLSVVCLKFLEEVKLHGNTGVVFLPTLTQMWILSLATSKELREKLINYIAIEDLRNLSLVLLPLHVKQCHWGLLCLDVGSKKLFYDDGLHWAPPNQAVELTKKLLDALKEMSLEFQTGFTQDFEKDKWDLSFTRFAMPDQPKTGVGSGSCGVGVILAAKDMFIQRTSLPTFFWTFDEMEKHRKEILFKIIQWMK
ncbi:uncharacterized protein LOC116296333 [Actinia tenebrosa]|uniref:Uncharacterized protein LOC116296333 n=1 Tax=Actinia tenebrosa TaxID=6105 RepID=A0A6P8HUV2_ACTTE|nr:uncharacterized protein LOC116296333 [Actinia tenebrosa]